MSILSITKPLAKWTGANPNPLFFRIGDFETFNFEAASSIVNSFGFVKVFISGGNNTFFKNDYAEVQIGAYKGIHKITEATSTFVILDTNFVNTDIANFNIRRYKYNQFLTARVFTGFPIDHVNYDNKPLRQTDYQRQRPFQSKVNIDVAPACRKDFDYTITKNFISVSGQNDLLFTDYGKQTSYYIEAGESFDVWFNGNPYSNYDSFVSTFPITFGAELVVNADFSSLPLSDFFFEDYIFGGDINSRWNLATSPIPTYVPLKVNNISGQIFQNVFLEEGKNYQIFIDTFVPSASLHKLNITVNNVFLYQKQQTNGGITINYKAEYTGSHKIGLVVSENLDDSFEMQLTTFSVKEIIYDFTTTETQWALNATKQGIDFGFDDYDWHDLESSKFLSLLFKTKQIPNLPDRYEFKIINNTTKTSIICDYQHILKFTFEVIAGEYFINRQNEGIFCFDFNTLALLETGLQIENTNSGGLEYLFGGFKKVCNNEIHLAFLNYLGGFDWWTFEGLNTENYDTENGEGLVQNFYDTNGIFERTLISKTGTNTISISTRTTKEYAKPLLEWLHRSLKVYFDDVEVLVSEDTQSYKQGDNIVIIETEIERTQTAKTQRL